jgi:hypothetical protein
LATTSWDYNTNPSGNNGFGSPMNWNASEACEYVPYHDGICTDGGFGSVVLNTNEQGSVYVQGLKYPLAIGDRCALGTDCTDCSALELDYADGYVKGKRLSASGKETGHMAASFNVSTNIGDVGSDSPDLDFGASGYLDLDTYADVYTMSLNATHARRDTRDSYADVYTMSLDATHAGTRHAGYLC